MPTLPGTCRINFWHWEQKPRMDRMIRIKNPIREISEIRGLFELSSACRRTRIDIQSRLKRDLINIICLSFKAPVPY
jgi:hypothetical protein